MDDEKIIAEIKKIEPLPPKISLGIIGIIFILGFIFLYVPKESDSKSDLFNNPTVNSSSNQQSPSQTVAGAATEIMGPNAPSSSPEPTSKTTPTPTPTPVATETPTPTPTNQPAPTSTPTPTPTPTSTPTPMQSGPTPTQEPTSTPTPTVGESPEP